MRHSASDPFFGAARPGGGSAGASGTVRGRGGAELKAFLLRNGFVSANASRHSALGRTYYPLHKAVRKNNLRIVQLLLESGVDSAQRDSAGMTPQQLAQKKNWNGSHEAVISLLAKATSDARELAAKAKPSGLALGAGSSFKMGTVQR